MMKLLSRARKFGFRRLKILLIDIIKFDERFYLEYYGDVAAAVSRREFRSGRTHFLLKGWRESRATHKDIARALYQKVGVGMDTIGLGRADMLSEKLAPLTVVIDSTRRPVTNVFVPTLDPELFFGGYIAFLHFLSRLVEGGALLRFVVLEDSQSHMDWFKEGIADRPRWLSAFKDAEFVNMSTRSEKLVIARGDRVIVYSAWMALAARPVVNSINRHDFCFFIQEYEPVFHPYDALHFLVASAYRLPHVPIFNSSALRDYFRKQQIGIFATETLPASDQLSFEHSITTARKTRTGGAMNKRLLFYARPEAHAGRNLFEVGVLALRECSRRRIIDNSWYLCGIGSMAVEHEIAIDKGLKMRILPRVAQSEYEQFIQSFDVGLSLMSAPHPGVVHFEWAWAGITTVVNMTPERDRTFFDSYGLPIVPADPSIDGIVDAIVTAIEKAGTASKRDDQSRANFATSWDESFSTAFISEVIRRCDLPVRPVSKLRDLERN